MTTIAVQEFLNKVGQDEALQGELVKAMDAENDRQAVTDLAESKGYDFTPDELWAEVQKRQSEAIKRLEEEGELSDEELEAVAGGGTPALAVPIVAATIVATGGIAAAVIAAGPAAAEQAHKIDSDKNKW